MVQFSFKTLVDTLDLRFSLNLGQTKLVLEYLVVLVCKSAFLTRDIADIFRRFICIYFTFKTGYFSQTLYGLMEATVMGHFPICHRNQVSRLS